MKKSFFTLFVVGLLVLMSGSVSAQSYGIYADQPGYMLNGDFLTDPDLVGASIGGDKTATVRLITNGDPDSVMFGQNAIYVKLTDNVEGKDRLEVKVDQDADMSYWSSGQLVFWMKLLAPTTDINFEISANRNNVGEAKGTDVSMKEEYGLDVNNDSTWQMFVIDFAAPISGDHFTFDIFESLGFRSRGNASEFIVDEMHVEYYGAYGITADKENWMMDGDFLTDPDLVGASVGADKTAIVRWITNGDADSVYFGQNAVYVQLTDNVEGKDRLEIKVDQDADMSMWNYGTLVFYMKLLAPCTDINFEISANRNGVGEAKGTDVSMKEAYGLDVADDSTWQKFMIPLTEPISGDHFSFDIFESLGFRSRGNASEFIIDEMHVILGGGYGFYADKAGYMMDGDFLTDPNLVGAFIAGDKTATVRMVTNGDADSVYFGQNAIYVKLTDNVEGKDRLEIKVDQDADLSFLNNGTLIFWMKLLAPCTDINFEISANRNGVGEAKGTDASMKDEYGLDVGNDSTWQMFMIPLTDAVSGDYFTFDVFESWGFRSRGNASEFMIDEMHVKLSSPLARYVTASDVATLDTLIVSVGDLTPAFNSETMAYTLEAPPGTTTVTVSAVATDTAATVEGTGDIDISSGTATATVKVTAEDGSTIKEYVIQMTRSNVNVEDEMLAGIQVYPNPVSTQLYVELGDNQVGRVDIVNLLGQKVISQAVQSQQMIFNVKDLSEGIYIIALDGVPYSKVVIRR